MKRLSDAELDALYTSAKKWGDAPAAPDYHMHLIQIELQLRTIDELRRLYGATH